MDKYVGKRLDGRYEIHELIGAGGMALVYKAYDTIEDRTVAIKILKDEFLDNDDFIRRFKNESKAIAVLSHPNIVKVYDVSFGDRIQYIVMEYIDGITLKEYISNQEELSWKEALHFTIQILKALQHAHEKGIVHRDIKPQNIMLLQDGTIKVTDFGIARFSKNETRTMTDKAIGSVHYIAPEQARGDLTDEKADIYSVGVMLYEMITGVLPFEADSAVSVAIMQMQAKPKSPREIKPNIPIGLEEITLKAMQKEKYNRFQSAQEMLNDISEFVLDPDIRFNYKYEHKDEDQLNNNKQRRVVHEDYGDNFNDTNRQEEAKKKTRTLMIIGGIAAAVVLIGLIFGIMAFTRSCSSSKDVEVPNFVGMNIADVKNNKDSKFKFNEESAYDPNQEEGIILDQNPKNSSKKVKEDATITLKVNTSGALVSVPNLKGLKEDAAKAKLQENSLEYEILSVEDDQTAKGIVKSTDPQAGSQVTVKTVIKVYVSNGPAEKKVNVPDVIGKNLSAAKTELTNKGLKISDNIVYEQSDKDKDTVLSTNPLPGVEVSEGTPIQLTLSNGEKKEKTIEVYVDLPSDVKYEVTVSSYIDGVLDSQNKVVPSYNSTYTLSVKGSSGTKTVNVNIDGQQYRVFTVNFDSSNDPVKTVAKYTFTPKEQSSSSPTSSSSSSPNSNSGVQ